MPKLPFEENRQRLQDLFSTEPGKWWLKRQALKNRFIDAAEKMIMGEYVKLYTKQVEGAIKALGSEMKAARIAETKAIDGDQEPKPGVVDIIFDPERLKRAVKEGATVAAKQIKEDLINTVISSSIRPTKDSFDATFILPSELKVNPDRLNSLKAKGEVQARAQLEERSLKSFAWVSKTTTEEIMNRVEKGVEDKLTIQQIASSLTGLLSRSSNPLGRAQTIARTEVFTASSIGQAAAMKVQAKVIKKLKKAWITAGDVSVRGFPGGPPSKFNHFVLQGEVQDWDKPFSNGLMHPHDPNGEPGDVINCRCVILTVSAQDADLIGLDQLSNTLPIDNPRPKE